MAVIAFNRAIGPIPLSVILMEQHESAIELTANPIETGAEVNDHAYIIGKRVTLEFGDKNAAATFAAIVRLQESRIPFVIVTGLKVYRNMMIMNVSVTRDKDRSSILYGSVDLQEAIIVDTSYSASGNLRPSKTGDATTADRASGPVQRGDAPTVTVPVNDGSPEGARNGSLLYQWTR